MLIKFFDDILSKIAIVIFLVFTAWWVILFDSGSQEGFHNLLFGAIYGTTFSLFGSLVGLTTAKYWGGWRSVFGKATIILSVGLFFQFLGQFSFSYYNIMLGIETPYPSLADIGYFGSIFFYIWSILLFAKASGVKVGMNSFVSQIQAVLIPVLMIFLSYVLFLNHYDFTSSDWLTTLLNFGYPIGQGIYVSLAILTYSLSRNILGGVMRSRILLIVAAFVAQYLADSNFLFQSLGETWYNGGYGDYLYLVSYFIMCLGIVQLRKVALSLYPKDN